MAEIKVTGEVTRVFSRGFVVTESREYKGKTYSDRFTVWGDGAELGDRVTVTGFHSVKDDTWTDRDGNERHTPQVSINQPKIEHANAPTAPAEQTAADPWSTPGGYNDESPF